MAFTHYQQIRDQELPSMEIDNVKAFLKDFSFSEDQSLKTSKSLSPVGFSGSRQVSHSNTPIPIMK